jgi:hypothetical protein
MQSVPAAGVRSSVKRLGSNDQQTGEWEHLNKLLRDNGFSMSLEAENPAKRTGTEGRRCVCDA